MRRKWFYMLGAAVLMSGLYKLADTVKDMRAARVKFEPDIEKAAKMYSLSPSLLTALFWIESRMNPDAIGPLGEIGLGQFMQAAADDIGVDLHRLKGDPSLQIRSAAQYLRLLVDRADGNLFLAVRGYNAGLARARMDTNISTEYAGQVLGLAAADFLLGALVC